MFDRKALSFARVIAALLILLVVPTAFGEDEKENREDWLFQSFHVKYTNTDQLYELFYPLPGELRASRELGLLVVHAPPQTMAFISDTIAKLDVPSQKPTGTANVELMVYLLGAAVKGSNSDNDVVRPLQAVVDELRKRFPYDNYRLLESAVLRVRSNSQGEASGFLRGSMTPALASVSSTYDLKVALDKVEPGTGSRLISLRDFRFGVRLPVATSPEGTPPERLQYQYQQVGINTQIDIREGEMVVVGKAGVQGAFDGIFVVLRAEVVD